MTGRFSVVDVIAPASALSSKDLKKSLACLKKMNLKPRWRGSMNHSSLFAQNSSEAFENFKKALESKDSFLIWSVRGGYGSFRLLKFLDTLKKRPSVKKIFIGHSDTTVLHDWIHTRWGLSTLHFPVLRDLPETALSSQNKFKSLLLGKTSISFPPLEILNRGKFKKKIISKMTGGNMTLIQSSLGTPWSVSRKGILFLEDVNEKPYRVHRMLWQMKHSGVFKNVRAVIFGKWQKYSKDILQQTLKPFADSAGFPVLTGLACGHGRVSDPLPLGARAELNLEKSKGLLKVSSPFSGES